MSEQECEQQSELTTYEVEKVEEAKLKAKYPGGVGARPGGHSAFLQKRLAKGQKFFDSGDYQMAKQKIGGGMNKQQPMKPAGAPVGAGGNTYATGDAIPTPETVPARKTSIIQPTKFNTNIS